VKEYIDCLAGIDEGKVARAVAMVVKTLHHCGEIAVIGNGGSLAIAEHFVSDLCKGVGFVKPHFGMIRCIGANQVLLTAVANDISYDHIFLEQLKGLGFGVNDLLISFSVSGTSPNIATAKKHYRENADDLGMPYFLSFVGGLCAEEPMDSELMIKCDACAKSIERYYGIVEGTFSCLAHEIAYRVNVKMREASEGAKNGSNV
jgi:D-sedoheptulose 7-phosphate isomerase